MRRGDIFLVKQGTKSDPRKQRAYAIVSRAALIESNFSTVICAPIFSNFEGLQTQVIVGEPNGLKNPSAVLCDYLVSIEKAKLTNYVGALNSAQMKELNTALSTALGLESL